MKRYDDEEFLEVIDIPNDDKWIGTAVISSVIDCDMQTANRRLISLAEETDIEVLDPTGDDETVVEPSEFDSIPRRQLGFRREPADPEAAPESLESGYNHADHAILFFAEMHKDL